MRLIRYGRGAHDENLQYYQDCYVEDYITLDGNDWTYAQHRNVDVRPVAEDFQRVVKDYLAWQIGEIIRNDNVHEESLDTNYEDCTLTDDEAEALRRINEGKVKMKEVSIVDFFDVRNSHNILKSDIILGSGNTPYVTASEGNSIMIGGKTLVITYQPKDFFRTIVTILFFALMMKMEEQRISNCFLLRLYIKVFRINIHGETPFRIKRYKLIPYCYL